MFRANVPIFVESDEIKCSKRAKSGELNLGDIVEAFKPCGKADSGKRRVVQGGLDIVNFQACTRRVRR